MKFESVTIKDIAKALQLSASTVSRALRDSYEISAETKKRVVDYAKSVDYRPNPSALNLKERRSRTIGIIIPEIANSFFSQIINGIESVAKEHGYNVIITQTFESHERELEAVQNLAQPVDGILISLCSGDEGFEHIVKLHDKGMPIVFFDRVNDSFEAHRVISNNYKGTLEATNHLLENGYKNIAFIGSPLILSNIQKRKNGYTDALKAAGITIDDSLIKYCLHGGLIYEEVEEIMHQLLSMDKKPDAILACSDKITTNCFRYCTYHDIKIPKDIALMGFSNLDLTEFIKPSLTIIRQQAHLMGSTAADLLIKQIESKRPITEFDEIILEPKLFIRDSSQPNHA